LLPVLALPEPDCSGISVGRGGKLIITEGAGSLFDAAAAVVWEGLAWFENTFQNPRVIPIDRVVINILTSLRDLRFVFVFIVDNS